jgi:hypothetical protein
MSKKIAFCLLGCALLLASGNVLYAQAPSFTLSSPAKGIVQLPPDTKVDLKNSAELTPEELKAALEHPACGGKATGDKSLTACYACTAANCGGICYQIPCGMYANANQQVPPAAGFASFVPGCKTTYVSTCNDLSGTPPCQLFAFTAPADGSNVCVNANGFLLQSVGCL